MSTHHMGVNEGPTCTSCGTSEARCARLEIRCCGDECTHFTDDAAVYPIQPGPPALVDVKIHPIARERGITYRSINPTEIDDLALLFTSPQEVA